MISYFIELLSPIKTVLDDLMAVLSMSFDFIFTFLSCFQISSQYEAPKLLLNFQPFFNFIQTSKKRDLSPKFLSINGPN